MKLIHLAEGSDNTFLVIEASASGHDFWNKRKLLLVEIPTHVQEYISFEDIKKVKDIPQASILKSEVVAFGGRFFQARYKSFAASANQLALTSQGCVTA